MFRLNNFLKFLFIIFLLFENNTLVTISRLFGFFRSNGLFFFGLNDNKVESILGFGKKEFFEISKCFLISSLQFDKTDNLPYSFVWGLANILLATSF